MKYSKIRMDVPYFQVPNEIFDIGLKMDEILVYCYLAMRVGKKSEVLTSYRLVAENCGISRDEAQVAVANLIEKNLI